MGKGWNPFKKGSTGKVHDKDFIGEALDSANPWLDTSGDEADARAQEYLNKAIGEFDNVKAPKLGELEFEDYEWLGDYEPPEMVDAGDDVTYEGYDPRLADLERVSGSAFDGISTDPRLKDAQLSSLSALEELAAGGGFNAADEANIARLQSESAQADRGRRDAILQNAAARGMGGSGMELLAQLDSSQAATDRTYQGSLDIAGMAQDRALDAMVQGGSLAGSIRGQDFGEQADVAAARDEIARFNAGNFNQWSQNNANTLNDAAKMQAENDLKTKMYNRDIGYDASKTNTGYTNDAAFASWQGRQGNANANTDTTNKASVYNKHEVPQKNFDNKLNVAKSKGDIYGSASGYWNQKGNQNAAANGNEKGAVVGLVSSIVSDERSKKDVASIKPAEIDEFLSAIQPKKFKYKNPATSGTAGGDRIGFMAQDVKDTALGKRLVREDEGGRLELDRDNLDGIILAALASMAKGDR